jgi:hypothetical protein
VRVFVLLQRGWLVLRPRAAVLYPKCVAEESDRRECHDSPCDSRQHLSACSDASACTVLRETVSRDARCVQKNSPPVSRQATVFPISVPLPVGKVFPADYSLVDQVL